MVRVLEKRKIPEEELIKFWIEWYQKLIYRIEKENKILKDKLTILKRKERPKELLSTKDGLIFSSFSHLDERTFLLEEIGGRGVGGIQIGVSVPPPTYPSLSQAALHDSISKLWETAMESYLYGNFKACIFQLGSQLEATLLYEIYRNKLKQSLGKKPTLGKLISFCEKKGILSKENNSLVLAQEVNKLRNEHVHLLLEKERPEDFFNVTERDEFIYMKDFKGSPPVEIKNGWISANGVTVDIASYGLGILYKHKADAKKGIENMKKILNILYDHGNTKE